MDWLYLIGRILFGMIFMGSGLGHLTQSEGMAQYAEAKGVSNAKGMVLLSGLVILLGGLSVILGFYMEIGTWLLILFLIPTAMIMHAYWKETDPGIKQVEMAQFMKNMSMAGAALILYWMVQTYGYGPMTLGQPM